MLSPLTSAEKLLFETLNSGEMSIGLEFNESVRMSLGSVIHSAPDISIMVDMPGGGQAFRVNYTRVNGSTILQHSINYMEPVPM